MFMLPVDFPYALAGAMLWCMGAYRHHFQHNDKIGLYGNHAEVKK